MHCSRRQKAPSICFSRRVVNRGQDYLRGAGDRHCCLSQPYHYRGADRARTQSAVQPPKYVRRVSVPAMPRYQSLNLTITGKPTILNELQVAP